MWLAFSTRKVQTSERLMTQNGAEESKPKISLSSRGRCNLAILRESSVFSLLMFVFYGNIWPMTIWNLFSVPQHKLMREDVMCSNNSNFAVLDIRKIPFLYEIPCLCSRMTSCGNWANKKYWTKLIKLCFRLLYNPI